MMLFRRCRLSLWEKCLFIVIPSAARDLLLRKSPEKSRLLGQTSALGMTKLGFFRSLFSLWILVDASSKGRRLKPSLRSSS
jgi:hypothetical protein